MSLDCETIIVDYEDTCKLHRLVDNFDILKLLCLGYTVGYNKIRNGAVKVTLYRNVGYSVALVKHEMFLWGPISTDPLGHFERKLLENKETNEFLNEESPFIFLYLNKDKYLSKYNSTVYPLDNTYVIGAPEKICEIVKDTYPCKTESYIEKFNNWTTSRGATLYRLGIGFLGLSIAFTSLSGY